eukprot:COSAG06_NODE_71115_length_187_cov_95.215909_1_plen_62_part_11
MFYQDRLWTGVRKNSKKTRYGTLKTDHRAAGGGEDELEGEETHLVRAILIEKMTVLPRQARD